MPNGSQVHIWVQWLKKKKDVGTYKINAVSMCFGMHINLTQNFRSLTTLLQNSSILSSGGICEPSELLSFWLDCELLLPIVLTPDSAPRILSSTCSHTLRHCRNSLATRRSCGTDGNLVFFLTNCNKRLSDSTDKCHTSIINLPFSCDPVEPFADAATDRMGFWWISVWFFRRQFRWPMTAPSHATEPIHFHQLHLAPVIDTPFVRRFHCKMECWMRNA